MVATLQETTSLHPSPKFDLRVLYRFEAKLSVLPIGLVPEGIRMANSFEGEVTEGVLANLGFAGARVWGIDHLLLRSDGVGVIDAQKTISAGERHLYEHVHGYCLPPAGLELPPLEALLDPSFAWPDALFPVFGFSQFRTGLPELAHLNRAQAVIEGWVNMASGGLAVETRLLEHSGTVEAPGC